MAFYFFAALLQNNLPKRENLLVAAIHRSVCKFRQLLYYFLNDYEKVYYQFFIRSQNRRSCVAFFSSEIEFENLPLTILFQQRRGFYLKSSICLQAFNIYIPFDAAENYGTSHEVKCQQCNLVFR